MNIYVFCGSHLKFWIQKGFKGFYRSVRNVQQPEMAVPISTCHVPGWCLVHLFLCFRFKEGTMEAIDEPHIQLVSSEEHNVSGGCRGTYPFWCTWWMFAIRCWQCSCSRINDAGMFDQLTISVTPFLMANSHRSFITLLIAICSPQNCYLWMLIPPNMVNYSNYR